ncbi:hypothetical protein [Marinifilum flexuosum]|uniref:Curli production assembly/transport component CsgG n=1 Tax=Marinifilum flexuosum TaxID=1117708 RepID=A0A419X6L0_9BACT|nr:hypothetical protein [Marinifilum flexuosum]RKE03404.1 hypothetical protein BXY64_0408 [Marinifilum flexuosum]
MKKLSVLLTLMMMVSILFAQEKKEVVLVGDIKCSFKNSEQYAKNVHDVIVQAFVEKGLHEVIDINTLSAVGQEIYRQSGEAAMNEANWKRLQEAGVKGADWVVTGTLSNYDAVPVKNDKGQVTGYGGKLNFVFKVTNLKDGTQKGMADIACSTFLSEKTKDAAIMKAVKNAKDKVIKKIKGIFPITAEIVEITAEKKGAARTLTIEAGAALGVQKGDQFKVCEEKVFRGKKRLIEIGRIKVLEVQGDDFAECKVVKGGDKILADFNGELKIFAEMIPRTGPWPPIKM